MKIDGNEIRPGNVIEHQGRLWRAVKVQHVKPGKGPAYMQVELKNLRDGSKLNERFRASETVERARLDEAQYQYLYAEGDDHTFMDNSTYEQVTLNAAMIGEDQVKFLQESMVVTVESYEGSPLGVRLPASVVMEIVEADAVVKGQTASSSYKPAVLENGVRILVPSHIAAGARVVINTADGTYMERAKS